MAVVCPLGWAGAGVRARARAGSTSAAEAANSTRRAGGPRGCQRSTHARLSSGGAAWLQNIVHEHTDFTARTHPHSNRKPAPEIPTGLDQLAVLFEGA